MQRCVRKRAFLTLLGYKFDFHMGSSGVGCIRASFYHSVASSLPRAPCLPHGLAKACPVHKDEEAESAQCQQCSLLLAEMCVLNLVPGALRAAQLLQTGAPTVVLGIKDLVWRADAKREHTLFRMPCSKVIVPLDFLRQPVWYERTRGHAELIIILPGEFRVGLEQQGHEGSQSTKASQRWSASDIIPGRKEQVTAAWAVRSRPGQDRISSRC